MTSTEQAGLLGDHAMRLVRQDAVVRVWECTECGVRAEHWFNAQSRYETRRWIDWRAPDGRTWYTDARDGYSNPPSCPLPGIPAVCPWEELYPPQRYRGAWGDVHLDTAMRTWCERHQQAVSECTDPGPYCPGWPAHEYAEPGCPGPCTGRENSCKCMCPACCGDTPDVWGAPIN